MRISSNMRKVLAAIVLTMVAVTAQATPQTGYFIYDEAGHLIGEYDANGAVIQEHIYLGDRPVAVVQQGGSVGYVTADQLNTPRAVTDQNATLEWSWTSDPFGNGQPTGSLTYNLRFPGQYYDSQDGNMQNWYRDYNPKTGRYMQSDPIGLKAGINTYTYVFNNPINAIDPLGLDATNWWNNSGGRNPLTNGPTNGNWGGKCWSGGQYACDGHPDGNAPPTDSADACYKQHDKCYDKCGLDPVCLMKCDQQLVSGLQGLPDDPKAWPMPPRPGTELDSAEYRALAIGTFSTPPAQTGPPYYP